MTDSVLKPLVDRCEQLDKELDKYFDAMEDMRKTIKSYEVIFGCLSEEKAKVVNAINFLEDSKGQWCDSNS